MASKLVAGDFIRYRGEVFEVIYAERKSLTWPHTLELAIANDKSGGYTVYSTHDTYDQYKIELSPFEKVIYSVSVKYAFPK